MPYCEIDYKQFTSVGEFTVKTIYKFSLYVVLLLSLLSAAPAQDKDTKTKKNDAELRLNEVRLNLSVQDAAGKPVEDIKPEDLKLYENGKEQKITYFAKKEPELNLALVVDNSFSFRPLMPVLTALTKWFADKLNKDDEGLIVRFINSEKISVEQDWTSDRSLLSKTAEKFYVEGGSTAVVDALYLATEKKILPRLKENSTKRYAIVLISDCEDRSSYYQLNDLFAKTDGTDLQIFVIALTDHVADENSDSFLRDTPREAAIKRAERIAVKTGGIAFFPKRDKDKSYTLSPAAEAIISELRSQYVIGYVPTYQKTDEKKRTLSVEVANDAKGEKRTAKTRDGFFFR